MVIDKVFWNKYVDHSVSFENYRKITISYMYYMSLCIVIFHVNMQDFHWLIRGLTPCQDLEGNIKKLAKLGLPEQVFMMSL